MSRRHRAEKREINPDPKFGDMVVTKFMNSMMYDGKKSAAERIVYGAFDIVEKKASENPIEVFHAALENVMPQLKCVPAALVVRPTRFRLKFVPSAVRPWQSAG
jgi:small subunit ribosomal protein S7